MTDFLEREYFNNTVLDYLIALSIIVIGTLLLRVFKHTLLRKIRTWTDKSERKIDDFIVNSIERFGLPALYYFIVYNGINYLTLSPKAENILQIATTVVITYFLLRLIASSILRLLEYHILRQEGGQEKIKQLGGLMIIINIVIWIIGIIFLIDNLGKDVTAIIAGLGIGGIAVALAAQNILGDLFNYFVIFFDRPFEVGDFIIIDDKMGTIEFIGIKTTRLRSLTGEQLIIGNSDLTSSRIHNYKRMIKRRIVFAIDVEYGTQLEKIRIIPQLLRAIVEEQSMISFDRAHFASYKDWSLRYEVVYWVLTGDFNKYMDIQQDINFRIYEEFQKNDITFAFPSSSLYIEKGWSMKSDDNKENKKPTILPPSN